MKILDIAFNDLKRSMRSLFMLGMAVAAPLLLVGLFYFALGGNSNASTDLPTIYAGVVNQDQLPEGSFLENEIGLEIRNMFFDQSVGSWLIATEYENETAAREALDRQEIGVAVIIPTNFTRQLQSGEYTEQMVIISDPTLTIAPQVIQNMVFAILDGFTGGSIAIETLIESRPTQDAEVDPALLPVWADRYGTWFTEFMRNLFHDPEQSALVLTTPGFDTEANNPARDNFRGIMAGQMVFFAFFTGAYAMTSILREKEEGTLARLFTTPLNRTVILAGKFLAVFLTVVLQGIVLVVAGHYAFQIYWGNFWAVGLAIIGQVIAASCLGIALISFVKTTRQAGLVLGGGLTFLGMISGLFTANINMPEAFTMLSNFTPQGWVIKTWKIVMDGNSVSDLTLPLVVLVCMGVFMFAIGAVNFRKRFAE